MVSPPLSPPDAGSGWTPPPAVPEAATAQALFAREQLPFPPVPAAFAARLKRQAANVFATRPLEAMPYDLRHFLDELDADPALADYAVLGFDGYGLNSWGLHFYLVNRNLALFVQLPWGGAYNDAEAARQQIAEVLDWTAELQARLQAVEARRRLPAGLRLQVSASRFGPAGWRWLPTRPLPPPPPWQPPAGMKARILNELDALAQGELKRPTGC